MRVPSPAEYMALDVEDQAELISAFKSDLPLHTIEAILEQSVVRRWGNVFQQEDVKVGGHGDLTPLGMLMYRSYKVFDVLDAFQDVLNSAKDISIELEAMEKDGHLTQEAIDRSRNSEATYIASGIVSILSRYAVANQHRASSRSFSRKEILACIQKQPTRSKENIESIRSFILLNQEALQHIDYDCLDEVLAVLSTPVIYQRMYVDEAMMSKLESSYNELSSTNYYVRKSMKELCDSHVSKELEGLILNLKSIGLYNPSPVLERILSSNFSEVNGLM